VGFGDVADRRRTTKNCLWHMTLHLHLIVIACYTTDPCICSALASMPALHMLCDCTCSSHRACMAFRVCVCSALTERQQILFTSNSKNPEHEDQRYRLLRCVAKDKDCRNIWVPAIPLLRRHLKMHLMQ
jgi:hypothetical protein